MSRNEFLLRIASLVMLYENSHIERSDATVAVTFHDGEQHAWDGEQMVKIEQDYALEKTLETA